jgi:hypothetical protein
MNRDETTILRLLAIHEAGHAVAAEASTGVAAQIVMRRVIEGGKVVYWGTTHYGKEPAPEHKRFCALAGAVAQTMAEGGRSLSGDALLRAIISRMSPADQLNAGAWTRADADDTIRWVLASWSAIEARADAEVTLYNASTRSPDAVASPAALPQASEICIAELASDPPVSAARAAKAAPGRDTIAMLARAWDCQPHEIDAAEDGLRVSAWARLGLPRDKLLAAAGEQHAALQARVAANDAARLRRLAAMA